MSCRSSQYLPIEYIQNSWRFVCCLFSRELGNPGQVIYCLQKAMRADPTDVDAKWDCASLYAELNDFPKAIDCLELCKMVAKVRLPLAQRFTECIAHSKMWKAKGANVFLPSCGQVHELGLILCCSIYVVLGKAILLFRAAQRTRASTVLLSSFVHLTFILRCQYMLGVTDETKERAT
jgi:hypothetical protein